MYKAIAATTRPIDISRLISKSAKTVLQWQDRFSQRLRLTELDERLLRDVGLSHGDVAYEAAKPFWRV